MIWNESIKALVIALGIGLMIGVVRERHDGHEVSKAGARTYFLIAALGAITWMLNLYVFLVTLGLIGLLTVASYFHTAKRDPGLTGEVTMILTFILAAMAHVNIETTAALGVLCAILLKAKSSIHRMSKELITEQELGEALLLLAAALIVLPLLPNHPIDPWGVIELNKIWRIVVLIMAMGMLGHISRRAFGAKYGLPLAGFFSGFASSTAAIASLGQRAKEDESITYTAASAALFANLSSLLLFISVIGTASPELLDVAKMPLSIASCVLLLTTFFFIKFHQPKLETVTQNTGGSFKLSHAVIIALAISAVSLLSFWCNMLFGDAGVILASSVVAIAEIHAAGAGLSQLAASGEITLRSAEWAIIAMVTASSVAKSILSFISGGKRFGLIVTVGLALMLLSLLLSIILIKPL